MCQRIFFADLVFIEDVGNRHFGKRVGQLAFSHGRVNVTRQAAQCQSQGTLITDNSLLYLYLPRFGLGKLGAATRVVFEDDAQLFDDVIMPRQIFFGDTQ